MGRLTKNTQRQPCCAPASSMIKPPSRGPTAVDIPTTAPNIPNAVPRSRPWNCCWMSPITCGLSIPPAAPCSRRAITSHSGPTAIPAKALAAVNAASAIRNILPRPWTSPSLPMGTSTSPNVRAYPDTTQDSATCGAPRPCWMEGSATLTMLTSSKVMNPASRHSARMRQRWAWPSSFPPVAGGPVSARLTAHPISGLWLATPPHHGATGPARRVVRGSGPSGVDRFRPAGRGCPPR